MMENNSEILLTNESEYTPDEVLFCLSEAARDIFSSAETDFEAMKNKSWYKRLWEIVTFSKDNQKKTASGVANLAKLQEIVMKALLVLSQENKNAATIIAEHGTEINIIAKKILRDEKASIILNNKINELKNGFHADKQITDLPIDKKIIIKNLYRKFINELTKYNNDYTRELSLGVLIQCDSQDEQISYEKITSLDSDEQPLLFRLMMSYLYLATDCFSSDSDALNKFSISNDDKNKICNGIKDWVDQIGKERYTEYLAKNENEDYVLYASNIDNENIVFAEESDLEVTDDETTEFVPFIAEEVIIVNKGEEKISDESDHFSEIRSIVLDKVNNSKSLGKVIDLSSNKKKLQLLEKTVPEIVADTIIAATSVSGGYLIFTTYAMYCPVDKKYVEVPYNTITEKSLKTVLVRKKERELIINDGIRIDNSKIIEEDLRDFLLMLKTCESAKTDKVTPFSSIDEESIIIYLSSLSYILKSENNSLSEVYKLAVFYDVSDRWLDISTKIDNKQVYVENVASFIDVIPYPSEKAITTFAMTTAYNVLSYEKWKSGDTTFSLTTNEERLIDEFNRFKFSGGDLNKLMDSATIEPRIIEGTISPKELGKIASASITTLSGIGLSAATYAAANALFWSTLWFNFIPGLGTIIQAAVVGGATATIAIKMHNNHKEEFEKKRKSVILEQMRQDTLAYSKSNDMHIRSEIQKKLKKLSEYIEPLNLHSSLSNSEKEVIDHLVCR